MTLPHTVFFPQALLPLHIFEPRYRTMLRDVLATNRIFAVARLETSRSAGSADAREPLPRTAAVGLVRACQGKDNATSDLLLQGLSRVEVIGIVREQPYRLIEVRPLSTEPGATALELAHLRSEVFRLLELRRQLGRPTPQAVTQFLETIDDADTFVDLAAFNLCEDSEFKQKLLETLDTHRRLMLFAARLREEVAIIRLRRKLQGPLADEGIANN